MDPSCASLTWSVPFQTSHWSSFFQESSLENNHGARTFETFRISTAHRRPSIFDLRALLSLSLSERTHLTHQPLLLFTSEPTPLPSGSFLERERIKLAGLREDRKNPNSYDVRTFEGLSIVEQLIHDETNDLLSQNNT